MIGRPLSPYAVTKYVNELYADVFARSYGFASIGLRYFNVFGPRQDPDGAYAAVIPLWIAALVEGRRDPASTATARPAATSATSTTSSRRTCSPRPGEAGREPHLQRRRRRSHHAEPALRRDGRRARPERRALSSPGASTATSAPATCATPRPTSAGPRPNSASPRATTCAAASRRPCRGTSPV